VRYATRDVTRDMTIDGELVPGSVRRRLYVQCPLCGHRNWNIHGSEEYAYLAHYLTRHVKKDE
jgi:hypothetical protein